MIAEILMILSLIMVGAGSYLVFNIGIALLVMGGYLGVVSFSIAYTRLQG